MRWRNGDGTRLGHDCQSAGNPTILIEERPDGHV
jgi:hypothetical protein